ncbi:hypothetical protein Tco_0924784 [Tanacetum coccineum]|uniref:Uncharacterized protein n=1 Tax=Tanacetum coccineum TaxID=301880 RepID=A0ABQ5D4Z9_9ASTR
MVREGDDLEDKDGMEIRGARLAIGEDKKCLVILWIRALGVYLVAKRKMVGLAKTELEQLGVQDLATAIAHAESLINFSTRRDSSKPKDQKVNHEKGGEKKMPNQRLSLRRLHSDAVTKVLTLSLVSSDGVTTNPDAVSIYCTHSLKVTSCKAAILSRFFLN